MKVVVLGLQWGDEGKGKIIDYLADSANCVIRFAGGDNAGHRIIRDGKRYDFHLIPSGLLHDHTSVVLGSAMVINPESFFHELAQLHNFNIETEGRLFISDRAHVVFPSYLRQDSLQESQRTSPIGTTGKGIGVAYMHKAVRSGIRMADINDEEVLSLLSREDQEFIVRYRKKLNPLIIDLPSHLEKLHDADILFEGAQGILLDVDAGSYPYVTSSNTGSSGVLSGAHIAPQSIDKIIGVCKAYTTRVGNGPFPSEYTDEKLLTSVREIGHEYGVTTGRPRRCGYLDLVALKYAVVISGITSIALTHLDVFDTFDSIDVCTAYTINGEHIHHVPASQRLLAGAKPHTISFPGWRKSISEIQKKDDLPKNAQDYVAFIENYLGIPIDIISVGPDAQQTILSTPIWN